MRIEDERAMRSAYKKEFGVDMALGQYAHIWKAAWMSALDADMLPSMTQAQEHAHDRFERSPLPRAMSEFTNV